MTPAEDQNLDKLHELSDQYWDAENRTKLMRKKLDTYIQELKRAGYSFPVLAKNSGLSQGTIQNIVAKDTSDE